MFNLLMFSVNWHEREINIPRARVFEYTDPDIAKKFEQNGRVVWEDLVSFPCLFCGEGTSDEPAYVGQINRVKEVGDSISLEIGFDADVPQLHNSYIYDNKMALGMPQDFEFSRNHWAVKNVDLYRFLLREIRPRRQRPTVFQISEHEHIESTLASAMMPFDAKFNDVYASIRQATEAAGLRCRRADDIWDNPSIIQDVVSLIDHSRVVVCDCTERNPNVFYEIGIAHTLGREVILITQNDQDIPFDLKHLRFIKYLNNSEGRAALAEKLLNRMKTILGN